MSVQIPAHQPIRWREEIEHGTFGVRLIEDRCACAARQALKKLQLPRCLAASDLQPGRRPGAGHLVLPGTVLVIGRNRRGHVGHSVLA